MSLAAIRDDLSARGARFIAPPVLQPAGLYLELVGEDIRRRVFMIEAEDGEDLCLRPDMTVPACRMALADGLTPSVLAYEGLVFRRQNDSSGKETEFVQIGAEWCGLSDDAAEVDAQVLQAALTAVRRFGVEPVLRLGDVALFVATAAACGWPAPWLERLARGFQRPDGAARVIAEAGDDRADETPAVALGFAGLDPDAAQAKLSAALAQAGVAMVGARSSADIAARLTASEFGDALRPFMHRKEAADAMASAMGVIKAGLPQRRARQTVQLRTSGAFGENGAGQGNMAFQNTGEAVLHFCGGIARADPDGAGNVSGAVQILPTAIDQINAVGFNVAVGAFIDLIMAMRAIGASCRDSVERQILEHAGIFAESL